jgi:leader peptidase (prepilin peptidase) / N-methyltransferase
MTALLPSPPGVAPLFTALSAAMLFALVGVPAGTVARVLLRRLRRGARVPPPWCEVGVALSWGGTGGLAGAGLLPLRWVPALLALGWLAVAGTAVDVRQRRLPDALTLPALPLAVLLLVPLGPDAVLRGLVGAATAFAAHAAVHLVAPTALGAGDAKLAAPLGAVLAAASWEALALGALVATLLSGALAAGVLLCRGSRQAALPHGPSMLVAGWLVATAAGCGARGP